MSKIKDFLVLPETKILVFFVLYAACLFGSVILPLNFFYAILIGSIIIVLWKILWGMSWVNFFFLFFGFLEANIISSFIKSFWAIIFILLFLVFFWKKCFSGKIKSPERPDARAEKYWREILFYYLFLVWIIISYGCYFFLNYSFGASFLIYTLGLILFSYLYFLFSNIYFSNFLFSFLTHILVNLEFFLLFNYLSLSVLVLSIFLLLVFRLSVYCLRYKFLSAAPL